jgi:uncharacterized membrane protein YhaH (DUF805 family)
VARGAVPRSNVAGRRGLPFNLIVYVVLAVISASVSTFGSILLLVYSLGTIIPALAVSIRRLHDTSRSGWWILIGLIPLVGSIVLLVFYASAGDPAGNAYGPRPGAGAPLETSTA